jgi:hypothetical protein
MKKLWVFLAVCFAVCFTGRSVGQEGPRPGPEHERLKQMEGTWDAIANFGGMESKGTTVYKMDLGGLWLCTDYQGEVGGQKFTGKGMDTYDAAKKKYVAVWCDSMSTYPMVTEGTYDEAKKTLTMAGDMVMNGQTIKAKMTTVYTDNNTHVFTMYDPKDQVMFTITYKRKS